MTCTYCAMQVHTQCWEPTDDGNCCCPSTTGTPLGSDSEESLSSSVRVPTDLLLNYEEKEFTTVHEKPKRGRPQLDAAQMKDPLSTGRKRAAKEAPIEPGEICEWLGLRYAGGGVHPVIGCFGNDAASVHHGPDKNVINNEVGINIHRICHVCHNRWHTLNDEFYGTRPPADEPFIPLGSNCLPHDAETKASPELMTMHEVYWKTPAKKRGEYPSE